MPIFDGDNLIITLDSGVTEVDVINDLYEPWKDWMILSSINRKYPQAFFSDGGNPLSSIINQGSYIFLNNSVGWRIKGPEENITIYFTGNLAVNATTLPALIPTVGGYTVAILGLQPITQGVTDSMATQLEANVFQGAVCIDVINGYSGTGYISGNPIGTRQAPSNNLEDAQIIAKSRGFLTFNLISSITISSIDLSNGNTFIGDSPFLVVTIEPSADVTGCALYNLTVQGELDGLNVVRDCSVGTVTNASGYFENCALTSSISLSNDTNFFKCYSQVVGSNYPIVDVANYKFICREFGGSLGIAGATTEHLSSIGLQGGRLVIEATCVDGEIHARGNPFEIIQNQVADILINETFQEAIWNAGRALTVPKFIALN